MKSFDNELAPTNGNLLADPGVIRVSVESFTASPATIKPFEASVLEWKVTSQSGIPPTVKINGQPVPSEGTMTVRPRSSSVFRLSVKHGSAFVQLHKINVNLDTRDCEEGGINEAVGILRGTFALRIEQNPEAYLLDRYNNMGKIVGKIVPVVKIDETGIDLSLRFGAHVDYFPDPKVKADLRFRWGIIDDVIEPYFLKQDISLSFPFYAWIIPGAVPGLTIASGFARAKALRDIRDGLIEFAALFLRPPEGRRIFKIRTSPESRGEITTEHCPETTSPRVGAPTTTVNSLQNGAVKKTILRT